MRGASIVYATSARAVSPKSVRVPKSEQAEKQIPRPPGRPRDDNSKRAAYLNLDTQSAAKRRIGCRLGFWGR
jgi:hypothetical protein